MKILIAGDFCDKLRVKDVVQKKQYGKLFDNVKDTIKDNDFSIVNFEFPIYSKNAAPIFKTGPNFYGEDNSIEAIKYAGFNICTLANNHILDLGEMCCAETIDKIQKAAIKTVGAGRNAEEVQKNLYISDNQQKVAIINCCEHEFSTVEDKHIGANPLNIINQYYAIREAVEKSDAVIVIVHGGHEHYQLPSPRMKETYRFFIEAGADAVICHHQHCYSGYEFYKGKGIFYGLGNFLFDHKEYRNTKWNYGYMVQINISENTSTCIIPYKQCSDDVGVVILTGDEKLQFDNRICELNNIIQDNTYLISRWKDFTSKALKSYMTIFEPYESRVPMGLFLHQVLPSTIGLNRLKKIVNYLNCESHYDCLKEVVELFKNKKIKK